MGTILQGLKDPQKDRTTTMREEVGYRDDPYLKIHRYIFVFLPGLKIVTAFIWPLLLGAT